MQNIIGKTFDAETCRQNQPSKQFNLKFGSGCTLMSWFRYVKKMASEPIQERYVDPDVPRGCGIFNPSNRTGSKPIARAALVNTIPVIFEVLSVLGPFGIHLIWRVDDCKVEIPLKFFRRNSGDLLLQTSNPGKIRAMASYSMFFQALVPLHLNRRI